MAMKQNNFYLRWQKAAGAAKSESRSQGLRTLVPGLAVVAVSMLGWGVLTLHTSMLKSQREDILNWCSDNTEPYRAATQDSESAAQFRSLTDYSDGMTELLNSYPDVTSSLLHRVEAAGGSGITIQFTDYNASTGELLFNANSSQVIDIPAYIRSLQNCGVFPPSATPATRPMTTAIPSICAVCWQRRSSKGGRYGNCTNDKAR